MFLILASICIYFKPYLSLKRKKKSLSQFWPWAKKKKKRSKWNSLKVMLALKMTSFKILLPFSHFLNNILNKI